MATWVDAVRAATEQLCAVHSQVAAEKDELEGVLVQRDEQLQEALRKQTEEKAELEELRAKHADDEARSQDLRRQVEELPKLQEQLASVQKELKAAQQRIADVDLHEATVAVTPTSDRGRRMSRPRLLSVNVNEVPGASPRSDGGGSLSEDFGSVPGLQTSVSWLELPDPHLQRVVHHEQQVLSSALEPPRGGMCKFMATMNDVRSVMQGASDSRCGNVQLRLSTPWAILSRSRRTCSAV